MPKFYLRTELGEFVGQFDTSSVLRDYIEKKGNKDVKSLTGWKCEINMGDVKIWGDFDEFIEIAKENDPKTSSGFSDFKFRFKPDTSEVVLVLLDVQGNETDCKFDGQVFIEKVVNELPNGITDAIIEEKEKRDFS